VSLDKTILPRIARVFCGAILKVQFHTSPSVAAVVSSASSYLMFFFISVQNWIF